MGFFISYTWYKNDRLVSGLSATGGKPKIIKKQKRKHLHECMNPQRLKPGGVPALPTTVTGNKYPWCQLQGNNL